MKAIIFLTLLLVPVVVSAKHCYVNNGYITTNNVTELSLVKIVEINEADRNNITYLDPNGSAPFKPCAKRKMGFALTSKGEKDVMNASCESLFDLQVYLRKTGLIQDETNYHPGKLTDANGIIKPILCD